LRAICESESLSGSGPAVHRRTSRGEADARNRGKLARLGPHLVALHSLHSDPPRRSPRALSHLGCPEHCPLARCRDGDDGEACESRQCHEARSLSARSATRGTRGTRSSHSTGKKKAQKRAITPTRGKSFRDDPAMLSTRLSPKPRHWFLLSLLLFTSSAALGPVQRDPPAEVCGTREAPAFT
jgi:hypothetical protein